MVRRIIVAKSLTSSSSVLALGRSGTGTSASAAYAVHTNVVPPASDPQTEITRSGASCPTSGSRSSSVTSRRGGTTAAATSAAVSTATTVRQATAATWPSRTSCMPRRRSAARSSPYFGVQVKVTLG